MESTNEDRSGVLGERVLSPLRATRPWVLLISILGFVGAAALFVFALITLFGDPSPRVMNRARTALTVSAYSILALAYAMASLHLFRFARAIKALCELPDSERLALSLGHLRSFWRLVGVLALIYGALLALGFLLFFVVGWNPRGG